MPRIIFICLFNSMHLLGGCSLSISPNLLLSFALVHTQCIVMKTKINILNKIEGYLPIKYIFILFFVSFLNVVQIEDFSVLFFFVHLNWCRYPSGFMYSFQNWIGSVSILSNEKKNTCSNKREKPLGNRLYYFHGLFYDQ